MSRNASIAFGKTMCGSSLAAIHSAALNAAPYRSRAAASISTGFITPKAIKSATVCIVMFKQAFWLGHFDGSPRKAGPSNKTIRRTSGSNAIPICASATASSLSHRSATVAPRLSCARRHLAIDLRDDGRQQPLLVAEAMIQGAAGEADLRREIVHRRRGETRCGKRLARCPNQLGAVFFHRFSTTLWTQSDLLLAYASYVNLTNSGLPCLHTQRM